MLESTESPDDIRTRTASRVSRQTLRLGERDDGLGVGCQPGSRVTDDAGSLHEVVYPERRRVPRGAAGREDVARSGDVVAHRLRGVVTEEDRARMPDRCGDPLGAFGHDLQMLRGPPIGHLDRVAHSGHENHESVPLDRLSSDVRPGRPRPAPLPAPLEARRPAPHRW